MKIHHLMMRSEKKKGEMLFFTGETRKKQYFFTLPLTRFI